MGLRRLHVPLLVLSCQMAVHCPGLAADDFAIETQVFEAGKTQPVAENLTVFSGSRTYDFALTPPQRTTVFDAAASLFRLSDSASQVLTTLPADQLLEFVATEQTRARQSPNAWIRFAASPEFEERYDASTGDLALSSPYWDYEVQTMAAPNPAQLQRYLQFAHWYTHLNALSRPLPPGVRLQLNESLATHERLPIHVVARIKRDGELLVEQESRHKMIWTLTSREQQQVRQWEQQQSGFRRVSVRDYLATYH